MPYMPIHFPAKPPGIISFDRVSKFPPEGKGNPVIGQPVFQEKQFRAETGNTLFPAEYRPYIIPSL
jgi:hypothetical protein